MKSQKKIIFFLKSQKKIIFLGGGVGLGRGGGSGWM